MIALTPLQIAEITGGRLVHPEEARVATPVDGTVETDSRLVTPGSVFFALRGEVTDGHLFVEAATANGAALVVAEREVDTTAPLVVVDDGVVALSRLAAAVVEHVRGLGRLKVVGVTGSNGKTSTKNMLRAVLSDVAATVAPQGSFNNHVGAPISMLRIDEATEYLVVEMGASGPGEIARLVDIARPDTGVVLKVGLAHAGGFGGIEGTRAAKAEMVTDLPATGTAVLNADDDRVAGMASVTAARVVTFGQSPSADYRASDIDVSAAGTSFTFEHGDTSRRVSLRILGEHHVMNALAALSVVGEWGVDLDRAVTVLEGVTRAERWRMEVLDAPGGVTVVNDAYNASPDSVAAALKTLAQITGPDHRSVAVLGEMAELGEYARDEHDRVGRLVVRLNVRQLVVVGHEARHIHMAAGLEGSWDGESVLVDTIDEAYDLLQGTLRAGDVVLVKSSKSAGLRLLGDRLAGVTA
ncbi:MULTISPECIES: UDP-N-acetylmuramoyl-tripeptide--D-alanyl-D-alanine ligase [unclassified Frigoribacterium]|uniref:UDP-N-acetylmuramoyl-tripeptide--D-alanyl-D- alanine ligase n=1 Tax=unclassified Frigoribacterium TaxID=2627005 RepID=UPI0006FCAB98|nr:MULTISPECIES: UDP-N-acetylmuramoyl-tripeptide--D-alanyl-D-alanine ligase [unclassified Frigoribacterium]KQO47147.1 UDP-N-acetylmuramoylalanyl-D-glutamate--2,6-diaminopimelate ligase [Frigoribacterium sp. Leaf254]KQT39239.1 UDP-N-acetylmuramoylalanyl-D-glutamate--2,6-diaminopimelate ligase [Frigoribacterium sp. Leaf415]